ncbi:MAG TPA: NAD(P)/FAD-dependent oxidoreductase, partial [Gemmatimonadales bacterium]
RHRFCALAAGDHAFVSPRVVVVGGGFAGLYLARELGRSPVEVTVVDRTNHHLFQPMLYQVATAALSAPDISCPIRSVLRNHRRTEVVLGDVISVDIAKRAIVLADGSRIEYDYLALAPGARHSYFSHPEWEVLAPGLKNLEDAGEIRRRILLAFERAERESDPVVRQRHLTFVIVGGGPTGVELAGAVAEVARFALRRDFRRIDPRDASILLLEAGPRLLTSYPPALSGKAKETLRRLGVDVRTETMVTRIEPGQVHAAGWQIPTDTVIWAAGNQASPLLKALGVPLDPQGRVLVETDCSIPGHREVFVLGDAAAFTHQKGYPVLPALCPVAIQMGVHAARAIRDDLAGRARRPFRYRDKGQLAVIGRGKAVADLGRIRTQGFLAWQLWIWVHIFFLIGFRNRVIVMFEWAWSYFTFQRGARVITDIWKPVWRSTVNGERSTVNGER